MAFSALAPRRRRSCAWAQQTSRLPGAGSSGGATTTSAGGSVSNEQGPIACVRRCSPAERLPGRRLAGELASAQAGRRLADQRRLGLAFPELQPHELPAACGAAGAASGVMGVEAICPTLVTCAVEPAAARPWPCGAKRRAQHRPRGRCLLLGAQPRGPFPGHGPPAAPPRAGTLCRPAWRRSSSGRGFKDRQSDSGHPGPRKTPRRRRVNRACVPGAIVVSLGHSGSTEAEADAAFTAKAFRCSPTASTRWPGLHQPGGGPIRRGTARRATSASG